MSLSADEIRALTRGEHGDPFSVLGPHRDATGALVIFLLQLSMTSTNWSTFVVQMVFGIVLVLAVLFNAVVVRRR